MREKGENMMSSEGRVVGGTLKTEAQTFNHLLRELRKSEEEKKKK